MEKYSVDVIIILRIGSVHMKKKLVLILFLSLLLMPFRTLAQEVELTNEDKFEVKAKK